MSRTTLFAVLLLAGLVAAPAARASGDGDVLPFALDPYGGPQPEQDAFYGGGGVGVLMGKAPLSRLFAGWRLLHGQAVGTEAGHGLALPCCDSDSGDDVTKEWMAVRTTVPGAAAVSYISLFRQVGDFYSVQTCFADAFARATQTLRDRVAAHGADDPAVRAWRDGQDAVFAACNADTPMPGLPPDAPDWLVKDRAYQAAAMALYERHFAEAEAGFSAIAADAASPWQALGPYLAARAAVAAAVPGKDPALLAHARDLLGQVPPDSTGGASAVGLRKAVAFRADPDGRRAALVAELTAAELPPTAAPDFKDLRRLGPAAPGQPEFMDWVSVFGRAPDKPGASWFDRYATEPSWATDADALAHARARWAETNDPAWLLAALQDSSPGPEAADLVAAARAVPDTSPAFLTATYHRMRLDPGDRAEGARLLDAVLARTDLSLTTRNLFVAQRGLLAADLADFARFARRFQPCALTQYGAAPTPTDCLGQRFGMEVYAEAAPEGRFGADALATIDHLPLDGRAALAEDAGLPAPLRLDVALVAWTGAVLAGDDAVADRLARDLDALLPALSPEWRRFAATGPGPDKRFAAAFVLLKLPGAADHLLPGTAPHGEYVRPAGAVKDFKGSWPDWTYAPAGAPPVPPAVPDGDLVCRGLCGGGAFPYRVPAFAAAGAGRVAQERGRYAPVPGTAGVRYVWEDVLDYVGAHRGDPRAAEALYRLVRVSRFGQGHARSSFRAFRLLQSRYGATAWAKQTRYFYD